MSIKLGLRTPTILESHSQAMSNGNGKVKTISEEGLSPHFAADDDPKSPVLRTMQRESMREARKLKVGKLAISFNFHFQ